MKFLEYVEKIKLGNSFASNLIVVSNQCIDYNELTHQYLKAMVCSHQKTYCDECAICKRINDNKYIDLIILDPGGKNGVTKEDIIDLQAKFSRSSTENCRIKLYVIKNLHLANKQVLNSLLIFLENPPVDTFALMFTNNLGNVLPTIVSRSQVIHVTDAYNNFQINDKQLSKILINVFDDIDQFRQCCQETEIAELYNLAKQVLNRPSVQQEALLFNQLKDLPKMGFTTFLRILSELSSPPIKVKLLIALQNAHLNLNRKLLVTQILMWVKVL